MLAEAPIVLLWFPSPSSSTPPQRSPFLPSPGLPSGSSLGELLLLELLEVLDVRQAVGLGAGDALAPQVHAHGLPVGQGDAAVPVGLLNLQQVPDTLGYVLDMLKVCDAEGRKVRSIHQD